MKLKELKVKIKSLVAEQEIIRKEEGKIEGSINRIHARVAQGETSYEAFLPKQEWDLESLRKHRRHDLRLEVRMAHVAYGYLRGVPYRHVENKTRPGNELNPLILHKMVGRFGCRASLEQVTTWLNTVPATVAAKELEAA